MDIQEHINKLLEEKTNQTDEWLIMLFGSREAAMDAMRYFVIEEKAPRYSVSDSPSEPFTRFFAEFEYRLRRKTSEELMHDRVDGILAMNTRDIPVCIVCNDPILVNDTHVETIHGSYHGAPKTCIEGHPD